MKKIKIRKLEDTSWLAQSIQYKMNVESDTKGITSRWQCLHTLHIIVQEADDPNNHWIYYDTRDGKRGIIICQIPDLSAKHGTDFSTYGMQCKLRGLAEAYKDYEGMHIVHVLTTHDLNSATITDLQELLMEMSWQ